MVHVRRLGIRRRVGMAVTSAVALSVLLSGCATAQEFLSITKGTKTVVDAAGAEYVVLRGGSPGKPFGDVDGNYVRNERFPAGLNADLVAWGGELEAAEFFARIDEAGMVDESVPREDAEAVVIAVADATNLMNQVLFDAVWVDATTTMEEIKQEPSTFGWFEGLNAGNIEGVMIRRWSAESGEPSATEIPATIHDDFNRFAQKLDEKGVPIAPLGTVEVELAPEYGDRVYRIIFPEVQYRYRVAAADHDEYVAWIKDNYPEYEFEDGEVFETDKDEDSQHYLYSIVGEFEVLMRPYGDSWPMPEQDQLALAGGTEYLAHGGTWNLRTIAVREQ